MSMRYKGGVVSAPGATSTTSAASGVWSLRQQMRAQAASAWPSPVTAGQQAYTTYGTYSWVAPAGVTSVSVVCVGPGGLAGGKGGGLGYKNNYSVTPGNSYTVFVGQPSDGAAGNTYFVNSTTVQGNAGSAGGGYVGDGGGNGGLAGNAGGGAGGYSGNGGNADQTGSGAGSNGSGGGGGGGGGLDNGGSIYGGGGGGGVGILGQGSNGTGGTGTTSGYAGGGTGGSGGTNGTSGNGTTGTGNGGTYGGGGAGGYAGNGTAGGGAVRIIWPGTTRQFPSTNTADM